jgi:hypothetical protein
MLEIIDPDTRVVNDIIVFVIDNVAGVSVDGFVPDNSKLEAFELEIDTSSSLGKSLVSTPI